MLKNLREICNEYGVSRSDFELARGIVGSEFRFVDLEIAPDGTPYLYRWHVVPHNKQANVYFHIQVADDPERPLHDHPWDSSSVILSGGYREFQVRGPYARYRSTAGGHTSYPAFTTSRIYSAGDKIDRKAHWGHRLLMGCHPYTMTLFSTGPKIREWGFWYPDRWVDADDVCRLDGNVSVHVKEQM